MQKRGQSSLCCDNILWTCVILFGLSAKPSTLTLLYYTLLYYTLLYLQPAEVLWPSHVLSFSAEHAWQACVFPIVAFLHTYHHTCILLRCYDPNRCIQKQQTACTQLLGSCLFSCRAHSCVARLHVVQSVHWLISGFEHDWYQNREEKHHDKHILDVKVHINKMLRV